MNAVYLDGRIQLVAMEEISNAMFLSMAHSTSSSRDLFLFHGVHNSCKITEKVATSSFLSKFQFDVLVEPS